MARTTIPPELVAINAIQGTLIADNSVTAVHIATNAISGTLVADNAITSTHIAQNNVTATQIAQNTITVTQLADSAVETAKLNNDAVTQAKIADDAVGADQLAANSVVSASIVNGTIVEADMADNAVTLAKMASLARGKIIVGDSAGDPSALAIGSNGTVLSSDGTDVSWAAASGGVAGISSSADATAITIDSSERVGIGTTSPGQTLTLAASGGANFAVTRTGEADMVYIEADGTNGVIRQPGDGALVFQMGGTTERMRIGNSGKTSWSAGGIGNVATQNRDFTFYTEGSTNGVDIRSNDYQIAFIGGAGSSGAGMDKGYMQLCLDGSAKIAFNTDGDSYFTGGNVGIGTTGPTAKLHLYTAGAEGINLALQNSERHYKIETDGGNLTFNDISAGGTARMTLTSDGKLFIRNTTGNYDGGQFQMTSGSTCQTMYVSNTGFADPQVVMGVERAASSAYKFFNMYSGRRPDNGGGDVEFQIRGDGNGYCDGSWSGGGADYAEYFEWSDGNASSQDRIGLSVVLDGNKIREATGSDAAGTIIGVISGNPAVVGDTAYTKWTDKYQKDDYGRYILDSDGHRQETSDYDDSLTYVEREKRKEWDTVGLMGKLRIKKGQQTGTNWIKMRDISDSVEEWLVR